MVLVADSTALGVWTYLARVLLEEYTWQCSCSSVFCHGGKGSPSGALCRRSSSTVHRSIYYQTLLSVLCYHLDSLVCLFVVFMFHPVTQGLGSLVPSPTPSFSSLLSTVLSSDEKLGVGLGTRLGFGDNRTPLNKGGGC